LRAQAAKPGQFKLGHQIAWSPDYIWLAILYTSGKNSRLLVIDLTSRSGLLDTLLQKRYQQIKFVPDDVSILADTDTIYFWKRALAGGTTHFRHQPMTLPTYAVLSMLKKFDFYCSEYGWNKDRCNPNGRGFANQYQLKTIQGDKVVMDQASGLVWQQGGSDKYMNFEAAKKWIENLNQQGYAGFKDWRLPTLEEAMSLMEPKRMNGDLYLDPLFDKTQAWIWTADPVVGSAAAWVVDFYDGHCSPDNLHFHCVRAVRSGLSSQE
jgi:hypothetical protein